MPVTHCNDGIDNDGDGLTDLGDFGCIASADESEYWGVQCDNGIDDDGDGLVDFPSDLGCADPYDQGEHGSVCADDPRDDADDTVPFLAPLREELAGIICPGDSDFIFVDIPPGIDGPSGVFVEFNFDPSQVQLEVGVFVRSCILGGFLCDGVFSPIASTPTGTAGVLRYLGPGRWTFGVRGKSLTETGSYTILFR